MECYPGADCGNDHVPIVHEGETETDEEEENIYNVADRFIENKQ